jgi:hypothetical protein
MHMANGRRLRRLQGPEVALIGGRGYKVQYLPSEWNTGMFGGNSNRRGPVWMPVNLLIVRAVIEQTLLETERGQVTARIVREQALARRWP